MRIVTMLVKLVLLVFIVGSVATFAMKEFFGMTVELDGASRRPVISFHDPDAHIAEIEQRNSAAQPYSAASDSTYWSDYRGPNRDGIYDETAILTDWPEEGLEELWRTKVGGGYASMVVAEGRVFTIEQRRDEETVAAYDLGHGGQLWETSWSAFFEESLGGDGPRATPTWHEGFVYALGAAGELRKLDAATGETAWRTNILEDSGAGNITWGMSGAPLVVDGKVIVNPGGRRMKSVVAYDAETGQEVWGAEADTAGYSSPQLATLNSQRQILMFTGERLISLNPEDGALLWSHPWETDYQINVAQPIAVDDNHVWLSSGYGVGSALLEISASGASEVWNTNTMKNKFNSSMLHEGHVYGFDDAIFASIDVRSGERAWKGGRYGFGQALLAQGHIIVLTEKGDVVLLEATPEEHRELARFSALSGKTWNVPAIADGRLIVRNQTEMAAYDLAP